MPRTLAALVKLLNRMSKEIAVPKDPLPLDEAMHQVRKRLMSVPLPSIRAATAVWLLNRLTMRDPLFTTVVNTLNDPDLGLNQTQISSIINALLKGTAQSHYSTLSKVGNGDRLKIHRRLGKKIEK